MRIKLHPDVVVAATILAALAVAFLLCACGVLPAIQETAADPATGAAVEEAADSIGAGGVTGIVAGGLTLLGGALAAYRKIQKNKKKVEEAAASDG